MLPQTPVPTQFPSLRIKRADDQARLLMTHLMQMELPGDTLAAQDVDELVRRVCKCLGVTGTVSESAVRATCFALVGLQMDADLLQRWAYLVAANRDELTSNRPVFFVAPGYVPADPWACLQFVDLEPQTDDSLLYILRSVSGPTAGLPVYKATRQTDLSLNTLMFKLGITSARRRSWDPREAVQLYLWGELREQRTTKSSYLSFGRYVVNPQLARLNAEITKRRRSACHRGYTCPCHTCPAGYRQDPDGPCINACQRISLNQVAAVPALAPEPLQVK